MIAFDPISLGITSALSLAGAIKQRRAEKKAKNAQSLAEATEADRMQRTALTHGYIDAAFDSKKRQQQYDDFVGALRGYYGEQLGRQKTDASRNLKFALAGSGLTGGSASVDAGSRLGDEFSRAAIQNERQAQKSLYDLKGSDEASRAQLHELATGGLSATEGLRRGQQAGEENLATNLIGGSTRSLGDVFSDTAATYKAIQDRAAARRGFGYLANKENLYGSRP